jgi:transcriptional regulator with XRE-family HTH domain
MEVKNNFNHHKFVKAIEESGLSLTQLADKINCKVNVLYRYINGEMNPRPERLKLFIDILGPSIVDVEISSFDEILPDLNPEYWRVFAWFADKSAVQQAYILGSLRVIRELGRNADVRFAAELARRLALQEESQKKQLG